MASYTVMNRLIQSFTSGTYSNAAKGDDKPRYLTRYFGGHNRTNHPFVNGYWQLYLNPPSKIFDSTMKSEAINWFHATCEDRS